MIGLYKWKIYIDISLTLTTNAQTLITYTIVNTVKHKDIFILALKIKEKRIRILQVDLFI